MGLYPPFTWRREVLGTFSIFEVLYWNFLNIWPSRSQQAILAVYNCKQRIGWWVLEGEFSDVIFHTRYMWSDLLLWWSWEVMSPNCRLSYYYFRLGGLGNLICTMFWYWRLGQPHMYHVLIALHRSSKSTLLHKVYTCLSFVYFAPDSFC